MTVEMQRMNKRFKVAEKRKREEAHSAAKFAMRLLVRAANQDRGLLEDKDWQEAMTHLNEIVKKEQTNIPYADR